MSHVKFLETRRHRAPGGRVTVKYERGKTYPFEPHMRAYLDIGHAELVEGVDATPPPAKAMPPSAMARKAKAAAGDAAPQIPELGALHSDARPRSAATRPGQKRRLRRKLTLRQAHPSTSSGLTDGPEHPHGRRERSAAPDQPREREGRALHHRHFERRAAHPLHQRRFRRGVELLPAGVLPADLRGGDPGVALRRTRRRW